jgi:uncharacterized protein
MIRWCVATVTLWLAVLSLSALAADGYAPIPRLEARVTDLTPTLTREQQAQLESQLASLERDKGAQLAILLVPTTQPESIEQYGIRVADAWKIGRKGVDDGVILIVAKNDRAVRIEVGYGLEGAIPDAIAKRIIEERITPHFRNGDFFGGLQSAATALGKIIGGEALPLPSEQSGNVSLGSDLQVFLLFALPVLARFARALFGLFGALAAAGLAGALALMIFGSWLAAAVVVVFVLVLAFASGGRSGWNSGRGGSWGGGGYSGGGGGWSGGGGGFGGGGASGRW